MSIININNAMELSVAIEGLQTTNEFDEPIPRCDEFNFCVNGRYVSVRYEGVDDDELYWTVDYAGRTRNHMPTGSVRRLCSRLLRQS